VGQNTPAIVEPESRRHDRKGQPGGPNSTFRLRSTIRKTRKKTMLAHAARTIHFAAMPMPSTKPRPISEIIDELKDLLWMCTRKRKYALRMKKIGKMSIIPMRDWMKNIPSKQARVAAAIANKRFGQRRRASRYIIGMHSVPKRAAAIRQPKVLNPRSM